MKTAKWMNWYENGESIDDIVGIPMKRKGCIPIGWPFLSFFPFKLILGTKKNDPPLYLSKSINS